MYILSRKVPKILLVAVHTNNHSKSCNSKIPQYPCLHLTISWSWKHLFLHSYFCLHNNNFEKQNKSMQCATTFRWRHFLSEFFDKIFVLWWDEFICIYQHLDIVLKYSCDRNYIMFRHCDMINSRTQKILQCLYTFQRDVHHYTYASRSDWQIIKPPSFVLEFTIFV